MRTTNIIRYIVVALLLVAGLPTAKAQGIRVHYKNGSVVDIPAALFDRMSPAYQESTVDDDDPVGPVTPDPEIEVEPLNPIEATTAIAALQAAGMPIYIGINPPAVSGAFSMKPLTLVAQEGLYDEGEDPQDDLMAEAIFKFAAKSGFNINVDMYDIDDETGANANWGADFGTDGIKAYIVGTGNLFTVGFVVKFRWNGEQENTGFLISGEVSDGSLKNMYYCQANLDKDYNLLSYGIVKDGDGNSPATTWAPGKSLSRKAKKFARRLSRKPTVVTLNEYSYVIYKTDGTELKVTQDELDYVETYEGSFDQRITQQIPQQYLEKMSAYMPIYAGNQAPMLNGTFTISKQTLVYDAGGNYQPGYVFADYFFNLTDQNKVDNTVGYQSKEVNNKGEVISESVKSEMVVLGNGQNFTVFTIQEGYAKDVWNKMATIMSGTMTEAGVKDVFIGILMLDKGDDSAPGAGLMDVGTYRIFKDGDGMAYSAFWPASRGAKPATGSSIGNLPNCSK